MAMQLINFSESMSGERDMLSELLSGLVSPSAGALQSQFTPQGLPVGMSGMPTPDTAAAPITPDQQFLQQPAMAMPEMPMMDGMEMEAPVAPEFEGVMPEFGGNSTMGLQQINAPMEPLGDYELDIPDTRGAAPGTAVPASLAGRAKSIYDGLRQRGFDHKLATATLGNLQQESNLDPNAFNPDEDAHGLMQWRGDRYDRGVSLARRTGRDFYDLENQLDLIAIERGGPEASNWAKAEAAPSLEEATAAIDRHVERSSGEHTANRVGFAQGYDQMFSTAQIGESGSSRTGTPFNPSSAAAPTGATQSSQGMTEMADMNAPRQGFFEGLGDYFKGEGGENDYDYSSMLAILSRGLGGMARGESYEIGDILSNQKQERLYKLQMYQQNKERQAAASYLEGTGRSDLASAVAAGGMDLGDALTVEQHEYVREQAGREQLETAEGRAAVERAMMERGYSAEEARTLAMNPDLIDNFEDAKLAQEEASLANAEAEQTREALISRYGGVPGYEEMVSQLEGGASPSKVAEAWNLDKDPLRDGASGSTPTSIEEYEYYKDDEAAAGREPLSYNDWKRQPTKQEITNIEGASPAEASGQVTRGRVALDTIDRAMENTSAWTTGLMSYADVIRGSKPHLLKDQLETIKSGIGFAQLRAMRDDSKSGASGLGQLTEKELAKLERQWGSLEASTNAEELRYNLDAIKKQYVASLRELQSQADKDGIKLSDYGIDTSFLDDAPSGATSERRTTSGVRWSF